MDEPDRSDRVVANLISHLGRITTGDGFISGLTAAQWTTLRYFGFANRFSRTVAAFAEFHSTTRGTASQTIKGLFFGGYIRRTRSDSDGRVVRLDLTDKGRSVLGEDPFETLVRAAGILPRRSREKMTANLERMIGYISDERDKPLFGKCRSCTHLECEQRGKGGEHSFLCSLVGEPLEAIELDEICVNFEPRELGR